MRKLIIAFLVVGMLYACHAVHVDIPDGTTSIGANAYRNRSDITSITIPNSVTSIGDFSFSGCSGLTSVTIPNSVTSIGQSAFTGCTGLTSVTIPNSVTSIESFAFCDCSSLTSVTIPDGVTSIDQYAFYGCSSLASATIPDGVTSIGKNAFWRCRGLTSVTIPDSVTSIGENAFEGCSRLTSVKIPYSVTSIGRDAFYGCSLRYDTTTIKGLNLVDGWIVGYNSYCPRELLLEDARGIADFAFYNCSGLTSVTIPSSVAYTGKGAFFNCSRLTSVSIPDSVTSIGQSAFSGCSSLTSVTIPNSVTNIESSAFYGCSSLTSVAIPDGVTSIGYQAFYRCSGLTSVMIPNSVTSIDSCAFSSSALTTVYVDQGDSSRVKELFRVHLAVDSLNKISFVEMASPFVFGDDGATVTGDAETGFTVKPSKTDAVVVTIPSGVDAAKVTVVVAPETKKITPNGAAVRIMRGEAGITGFLDIPPADASGAIDLSAATVKEEIAKEPLDAAKGAVIDFASPNKPTLTTAPTREGLVYRLKEGATLEVMEAHTTGDSKVGDGSPWTPTLSVTGGASGFYTIQVTK